MLVVIGVALWMLGLRVRGSGGASRKQRPPAPVAVSMVECAHCGLHLPVADAVAEGSRLYCSDEHRRLGPAAPSGQ